MSLSVEGYYSEFDYYDLYDAIYQYYDDIDRLYDWLESPHPRRGDIKIELISPQGTSCVLLPYRNYDFVNDEGYDDWPFMSVHFWGENPVGTWTLKITYKSGSGYVDMSGLSMTLYGTATVPPSVSSIPTTCDPSCARGCFSDGPLNCDSCQEYRVASTLECVDECPNDTYAYNNYCLFGEPPKNDNHDDSKDTLPVAIGVPVALVVLSAAIIIPGAAVFAYTRSKRKARSARFVRMISTEEDT